MFRKFKGGPDWIVESNLAKAALMNWRTNVRAEYTEYQAALQAHMDREAGRKNKTLDEFGFLTRYKFHPLIMKYIVSKLSKLT